MNRVRFPVAANLLFFGFRFAFRFPGCRWRAIHGQYGKHGRYDDGRNDDAVRDKNLVPTCPRMLPFTAILPE